MRGRLPVIPTLIVAAAVAVMITLGLWQLRRAEWKDALLARYSASVTVPGAVEWPNTPEEREDALYRRSAITCAQVVGMRETAGRSALGQPGWAHVARCRRADGGEAEVALGWSREPDAPTWAGGTIAGTIAPAGEGARLIAATPPRGLEPLARPDPRDLPNNHLAYAIQWFFFAATAVVVYALALKAAEPLSPYPEAGWADRVTADSIASATPFGSV